MLASLTHALPPCCLSRAPSTDGAQLLTNTAPISQPPLPVSAPTNVGGPDLRRPAVNNPVLLQIQPLAPAASNSSEIDAEALSLPSVPAVAVINFQEAVDAVKAGNLEAVRQYLAQPGINIHRMDSGFGWTLLHYAAELPDLAIARLLVEAGAEVESRDRSKYTPVHIAAGRSAAVLNFFAQKGADLNVGSYTSTPLISALSSENEDSLKILIPWLKSKGIEIDAYFGGMTPLQWAAHRGCPKAFQLLLNAGADIRLKNVKDQTLIEIARETRQDYQQQLARLTLEQKEENKPYIKDLEVTLSQFSEVEQIINKEENHKLFQEAIDAVKAGQVEKVGQYLAQPGIDIDQTAGKGWTLLHYAARLSDPAIAALLVQAGAQLGIQRGEHRWAPAHVAAGYNLAPVLEILAAGGANLNEKDADNITPLHYAARNDAEESATLLIDWLTTRGIGVDSPQKGNWTPLHFAAQYGRPSVAQLLVDANADVSLENARGQTPIEIARQKQQKCSQEFEEAQKKAEQLSDPQEQQKNQQQLETLEAQKNKLNKLVLILSSASAVKELSFEQAVNAVKAGRVERVKQYLAQPGIDIDRQVQSGEANKDKEGWTLLHFAALLSDPAIAALLVKAGAQLGIQDKRGFAPVHVAAGYNSAAVLKSLAADGADLNEKGADNVTLLHYAARNDAKESATLLINWLITRGIGVDSLSKGNWTPLHFAAQYGCPNVAQLLVDAGADVSLKNARGQTPIEIAQQKQEECWQQLEEARNAQQSLPSEQQEKNQQRIKELEQKQQNLDEIISLLAGTSLC